MLVTISHKVSVILLDFEIPSVRDEAFNNMIVLAIMLHVCVDTHVHASTQAVVVWRGQSGDKPRCSAEFREREREAKCRI